ncbi:MAG TPA: folylpolyglutamate synthase/dihydrofolate synthase family protein [Chitinophagaceae bacterium]|jgi:dihydrofolate synthase/folylpolyglutamate synthase|nr:folylpolyglutamate synthase/dihydrofolate synthase family protein [Chitinophagaceae bacterium]
MIKASKRITYKQTLDYLFARLPMFSHIGAPAFKKDLTNIRKLCEFLDQPQKKFKAFHIAGTNGKGSVSHMLAAILQTAGYKTGLYTSPHLQDFRERIKINGEICSEEFIIDFTEKIKPVIEEIDPSFFEITVAMAFEFFAEQKTDIAIIETGLGGRFDSTNIIMPELSVITNIGLDHTNILGDSLEKIAYEKAGIIKQNKPVVVGEILPETEKIFDQVAREKKADLIIASGQRQAISWHWKKHELVVEVAQQHKTDHQFYHLDLPGIYQIKNLITVLETCSQLQRQGWHIEEADIKTGLQQAKKITGLHGRWEVIHQHPLIVLDVAHNEDGIKLLMEQIEVTDHEHLHIIFGMVKDKDLEKILPLFPKLADYYFTQANIPRALDADILKEKAEQFELKGEMYPNVNNAIKMAMANASKDDLILVCGSVFLIGEVEVV